MPRKIIRAKVVQKRTGFSRTQVWRKSNNSNDDFPSAVVLGPNTIGWFEDEIDRYLESRPRGNLPQAPNLEEYQRSQRKPQTGAVP